MKTINLILSLFICSVCISQSGTPILRIDDEMHSAISRSLSVDKAGKLILTCSEDKTARLWDAATGTLLKIFRVPADLSNVGKLYTCALSPDGKRAALGGWTSFETEKQHNIYIVDVQTGEIVHVIKHHPDIIDELEFTPDGRYLVATIGGSNGINIYNTGNMELYKILSDVKDRTQGVDFDQAGRMAIVSYDGKIRLYDKQFSLIKEETLTAGKRPFCISFHPKGTVLAVGYIDSPVIELRDGNNLAVVGMPDMKGANINRGLYILQFSANGDRLIGGGVAVARIGDETKKILRVWDKGGTGTYRDNYLSYGSFSEIELLADGGMAFLTMNPELIVTDKDMNIRWSKQSGNFSLAARDKSHFRISSTGSVIGFKPLEKNPVMADIINRQITNETADIETPVLSKAGIVITDWDESTEPKINGIALKFLQRNERNLCADISNAGEVVFGSDFTITKTDSKGTVIWKAGQLPGTVWAVNISGNDKVVTAALNDGTIRWYRMTDGKEILAFYLYNDYKRWLLFTPSGYYDASPGAEGLLGWHINNGPDKAPSFYPLSRFKDRYYRPDIIDAILEVYYEGEAIGLANSRSNKRAPATAVEKSITEKLPPTVSIISPANGSTVSSGTVNLVYTVKSPSDAPAKNIRVLVNGRPVATKRGVVIKGSEEQKTEVTIPSADATITVLAENDNGTSPEANLHLKWAAPAAVKEEFVYKPKLYVLAIGVSDYNDEELKLKFAAKDAGDFATSLEKQKGSLYADVIIKKLLNKDATKDAITDGLDWIQRQTGQKDVAMIFFAGHGINDNNGVYYMLPVAADLERIRTTCLNFEELRQTVSSIPGKVLVFIDACHSGNAMGSTRRGATDINAVVNELSSTENGAVTFTSSTGKQFSLEDPAWGNGAFTKAVIEGLSGKAVMPGKNKITVKSLDAYISERVKELTKGKQHPTSVTPPNVPDFPIGITQ